MLITGKKMLTVANKYNFAVPAFNISDWTMFNGIVDICEAEQSPLIVAIHPDELRHITSDLLPSIIARTHRATIPITIHLDHGANYDQALLAIQVGFNSLMIDGSMLPFDQNVTLTRRVTETAHKVGLAVEGELGTIGKMDEEAEDGAVEIIYTDPDAAVLFIKETGVDSLAVAIGTSHGIYPSWLKPKLKLDLLKNIKTATNIPLVLHGGSGNPDDEIAEAVKLGINKINISSDIKHAYYTKMREVLKDTSVREPNTIQPPAIIAMKATAKHKINLFDAAGKATRY